MIRVAVVDDHPLLRTGVAAVLDDGPGTVCVGTAGDEHELWPLLTRTRPDAVMLDYHLPGTDGLHLCRRIKADPPAPRVLVFSAYASDEIVVAAALAGADGVVAKGSRSTEVLAAVRAVMAGERVFPVLGPDLLSGVLAGLDGDDLPVVAMLLEHTPQDAVAATLDIDRATLVRQIDRIIGRLLVDAHGPVRG